MQLELFQHRPPAVIRAISVAHSEYRHFFGGAMEQHGIEILNSDYHFHLLYVLDTNDPLVPISIPSIRFFPILFNFRFDQDLIYRMVGEGQVEIIEPREVIFDEYPYEACPPHFALKELSFAPSECNPQEAQGALNYEGVFGLEHLSRTEKENAIAIANESRPKSGAALSDSDSSTSEPLYFGFAPFVQGYPSNRCQNPNCTAEIEEVVESQVIDNPLPLAESLDEAETSIPQIILRKPSLEIFAICQVEEGDDEVYDTAQLRMYFSRCRECGCITASHEL